MVRGRSSWRSSESQTVAYQALSGNGRGRVMRGLLDVSAAEPGLVLSPIWPSFGRGREKKRWNSCSHDATRSPWGVCQGTSVRPSRPDALLAFRIVFGFETRQN